MVRFSQDNGVIETNCVIWVIGQMSSDVRILWRFWRRTVVIDTSNQISWCLANIRTATVTSYIVDDAIWMENLLLLFMVEHIF